MAKFSMLPAIGLSSFDFQLMGSFYVDVVPMNAPMLCVHLLLWPKGYNSEENILKECTHTLDLCEL